MAVIDFTTVRHRLAIFTDRDDGFTINFSEGPFTGDSIVEFVLETGENETDTTVRICMAGFSNGEFATVEKKAILRFLIAAAMATVADRFAEFMCALARVVPDDVGLPVVMTKIMAVWNPTDLEWTFDNDEAAATKSIEDTLTLERSAIGMIGYVFAQTLIEKDLGFIVKLVEMCQYQEALTFQSPSWQKETAQERLGLRLIVNPDWSAKS